MTQTTRTIGVMLRGSAVHVGIRTKTGYRPACQKITGRNVSPLIVCPEMTESHVTCSKCQGHLATSSK